MKISIAGKNLNIGESLHNYIEESLKKTSDNYLKHVVWVDVVISKHSHIFHVDVIIHDSNVGTIKATCEKDEVYSAFDSAIIRIEKQLRRYKHKIIKKNQKGHEKESVLRGTKYILSPTDSEEVEQENDVPITIAEKVADIEKMTVSEAIMQMDLKHLPALLFINEASNRLNVVYYRADGNISWIDPGSSL